MVTTRRSFLQTAAVGSLLAAAGATATHAMTPDDPEPQPSNAPVTKYKMLILGGTGFLGPAVVEKAVARGHTMTLFNRGKTNPHLFPHLEQLRGDRDTGDLKALKGRKWDVVIDTSAYVPAHVQATATMLGEHARQYVLLSSVGVFADHGQPADEPSPVAEITDEVAASMTTIRESLAHYGAMKARCEKAAQAAMPGRVTVIRPGLIAGPRDWSDRFTYWAVRVADGGEMLAPGDGLDPVQYVDVRDLADWIIRCIEHHIAGLFCAISPAGRFNMAELLYGMKAATTTDASITWVNEAFLEANEIQAWGHMPIWMPRSEPTVSAFHLVSSKKAVQAGLVFRPLAETARDTVAWHHGNRPADYEWGQRAGISREREAQLLKAWHKRDAQPSDPATSDAPG